MAEKFSHNHGQPRNLVLAWSYFPPSKMGKNEANWGKMGVCCK